MRNLRVILFVFAGVLAMCKFSQAQSPSNSPLPLEAREMMSKLVGTWTTQGMRDGVSFSGIYQARWNESHTGLVYQVREGNVVYGGVGYWDFKTKELVETWPAAALTAVSRFQVDVDNPGRWTCRPWLQLYDGQQVAGTPAHLEIAEDEFKFIADAGAKTLTTINQRVKLSDSQAALQDLGDFLAGGTWVCHDETPPAKHTYRWRDGHKILMLDRQGGRYPGISMAALDHHWQCVRFIELDNSGMLGSAILIRDDQDTWRLFGRYESEAEVQDLQITLKRQGPNEIRVTGIETINDVSSDWKLSWKRTPANP